MAVVTIGKSYFEALLRRAEFHTTGRSFDTTPSLSSNVTISKAEHESLHQAVCEYNMLKNALFRGGLTADTLETLLSGESGTTDNVTTHATQNGSGEQTLPRTRSVPIKMTAPVHDDVSPDSDNTAVGDGLSQPKNPSPFYHRGCSFGQPESSADSPGRNRVFSEPVGQVQVHDQRTVLVTNLSDRTTHKDLASIVRGGRLLDIFLRSDRSATISFVEGAADFLAYAKRNDIYLHTKRLEFRWHERQFHVPPHVANKIASGSSRNLVVRGALGKLTADRIRDHLDHIHNLVVIDIYFRGGDAYISTNSIHNALFAKTCMMSRTAYKGLRVEWYADECAIPLPRPSLRVQTHATSMAVKSKPTTNQYTLLDTGSGQDSDSEEESLYMSNGIPISNQWADAAVA